MNEVCFEIPDRYSWAYTDAYKPQTDSEIETSSTIDISESV